MNQTNTALQADNTQKNSRIVIMCLGMVFGMAGLAYASVPLYQLFCQVTGYGGTTQRAETVEGIPVIDRKITVRFDANSSSELYWKFAPAVRDVEVQLGERKVINYVAENLSNEPITGMATFNVTPQAAGAFFSKIECFCFTETRIEPGEKLEMPVIFFVDPELDQEQVFKAMNTITLSYTFFASDEEPQAHSGVKPQSGAGEIEMQKL